MDNFSLKERIYRTASEEKWVNGAEFERLAQENGYKASNAGRRCRDLVKEERFERKIMNGTVWYRRAGMKINGISPYKEKLGTAKLL